MWKFLQSPLAAGDRAGSGSPAGRKAAPASRVGEASAENSLVQLTDRISAFVFGASPPRKGY